MKIIKYNHCDRINHGTEEEPIWEENLSAVTMPYSEANEAIAQKEAYNGEYIVEDDGQPEIVEITVEDRVSALEKAVTPGEYVPGKWYYKGDRISYNGAVYVCIAPNGVVSTWNPDEYPAYWRMEN